MKTPTAILKECFVAALIVSIGMFPFRTIIWNDFQDEKARLEVRFQKEKPEEPKPIATDIEETVAMQK